MDEAISSLPLWFDENLQKVIHLDGAFEGTEFMPDLGPSGRWMYYAAAPIRDTRGFIIGAVETLEDITQRKQVESALKLALKKLNLLSSVTRHDIMNKITILSASLYLIIEFVEDPEGIELLDKATKTVEVIKRQIAFTREYQGLGINDPAWQKISDVIHSAIQEMGSSTITFKVTSSPLEIYADPLLVKVFYNLFENARQHGETVSLISVSDTISETSLILTVEDNGVGISNEDKSYIFKSGYGKNTGFGLFLSSEIFAITGITIRETGSPGTGAVFEIIVPEGVYRVIEPENPR
ncbi:MAG: ATP-binding protein [Methanobacteriota archaeon]